MDFAEGTRCYFFNSTQISVWLRDIGWWKHVRNTFKSSPMSHGGLQTEQGYIRGALNWQQSESRGAALPRAALTWMLGFFDHPQRPRATSGFGIRHASWCCSLFLYTFFCYLPLVIFPSPVSPYFPSESPSLALFLGICLARTTECPWRRGMQQKACLKESSGCKPFI